MVPKELTWLNEPCCEVRKDVGEMARLSLTIGNFCHPKPGHQFFKSQMECVGHGFFLVQSPAVDINQ